eukprot:EG_transcript_13918
MRDMESHLDAFGVPSGTNTAAIHGGLRARRQAERDSKGSLRTLPGQWGSKRHPGTAVYTDRLGGWGEDLLSQCGSRAGGGLRTASHATDNATEAHRPRYSCSMGEGGRAMGIAGESERGTIWRSWDGAKRDDGEGRGVPAHDTLGGRLSTQNLGRIQPGSIQQVTLQARCWSRMGRNGCSGTRGAPHCSTRTVPWQWKKLGGTEPTTIFREEESGGGGRRSSWGGGTPTRHSRRRGFHARAIGAGGQAGKGAPRTVGCPSAILIQRGICGSGNLGESGDDGRGIGGGGCAELGPCPLDGGAAPGAAGIRRGNGPAGLPSIRNTGQILRKKSGRRPASASWCEGGERGPGKSEAGRRQEAGRQMSREAGVCPPAVIQCGIHGRWNLGESGDGRE